MASYLEEIPTDVLHYIAFLVADESLQSFGAPRGIFALLQTCSTIYRSLCTKSCPHLYADIFRARFDCPAIQSRFKFHTTDSALTSELLARCRMLQRLRRQDYVSPGLRQDLWTAFWMIQESDGPNELHLHDAGVIDFLVQVAKSWHNIWDLSKDIHVQECQSLVIWLLCFTLTRQKMMALSPDVRETIYSILLPYSKVTHKVQFPWPQDAFILSYVPRRDPSFITAVNSVGDGGINTLTTTTFPFNHHAPQIEHEHEHGATIIIYARRWIPRCPEHTTAAINLLFCLKEVDLLGIPEHLPESRAIAIATQRIGPTKEDLRRIRQYRTKLFADTLLGSFTGTRPRPILTCDDRLAKDTERSKKHDREFQKMVYYWGESLSMGVPEVNLFSHEAGSLTGVWEGFYMVAGSFGVSAEDIGQDNRSTVTVSDYICRKPIQCAITEYLCFEDISLAHSSSDDFSDIHALPRFTLDTMNEFEFKGRKYERYVPGARRVAGRQGQDKLDRENPKDVILFGETLEEHEQAWGGFTYVGRVRGDSSIILKREHKETGEDDGDSGTWIFEGKLRFGLVFVGSWRLNAGTGLVSGGPCVQGIFSMQKLAPGSTSW